MISNGDGFVSIFDSEQTVNFKSFCCCCCCFLNHFYGISSPLSFPCDEDSLWDLASPPPSFSSLILETPSVIMMGCWGPSISPWERGWGRAWCRGMRAKARALCQVTKAFQHNNSYQSLPEPVGLFGSLYSCSGVCRCLFKGCGGWGEWGFRGNGRG